MNHSELEKKLNKLHSLDTSNISIDEIKDLIKPLLGDFFTNTILINHEHYIFRSTYIKDNVKPCKLAQIIYPPKEKLILYQRVNRPRNPVFYASSSMKGAVLEGRFKTNQRIAVSEWEVLLGQVLIPSVIGFTEAFKLENTKEEIIKTLTKEQIKKNFLVMNFLSELFSEEIDVNHRYKLSIAISESIGFDTESTGELNKIKEDYHKGVGFIDALLYPSIQSIKTSDNLAIRRHSFHKKLKLVSVDFYEIEKISKSDFKYKELDFANQIDENGNIIWKGRPGNYVLPKNAKVSVKALSTKEFFISRIDGKKMYRN